MTDNLLVTTDWLAAHVQDTNLRVVDIRGHVLPPSEPLPHYFAHRAEYEHSHIPGAVFVDWTDDIVEPGSRSYDVANPHRYQALMESLGIGDETYVVAYDDADGMFAARMWWTLQYYGHQQAAVLNGGWQKWCAEGRPVTSAMLVVEPSTFTPQPQAAWNTSADDILAQKPTLIDTRTPAEFAGQVSRAARKGHIPGAVNVPRQVLVENNGMMRPAVELQKIFLEAGITQNTPDIVVYCNGGVSASYTLMALKQAGLPGGRIYDGSWKDWGNDETKPIE